jgi:DNA end-binding protein Ku
LKLGHAIWDGNIVFASVAVPVKLHPAVREGRVQFHLLHRHDLVKLQRQMVCAYDGAMVPVEDQVRGFELEDGKYILVDPADLKRFDPEASRTIEVHEFVPARQIDPVYLEYSYYLEPGPHAEGYGALVTALSDRGLAGVCTWTMRKRSYVGALGTGGKLLRLYTLRHAGEVITAAVPKMPVAALSARELKVGADLINQMTGRFRPRQFEDKHQEQLRKLIDRKARGRTIRVRRPRHVAPTAPGRLLEVLEAGLKRVA